MELIVKRFDELAIDELYEILRIRADVFIVEQSCIYQDIDGKDRHSRHLWLKDEDGIHAYLRVIEQSANEDGAVHIGRVVSVERRRGYATRLLTEGIRIAKEELRGDRIVLSAQTYAAPLYEKAGFKQVSEEYPEDGLPHIRMELSLK